MENKLDNKAFRIDHQLNRHFEKINSFKTREEYEKSTIYHLHGSEIDHICNSIEWKNVIDADLKSETIRVVSWNVERGTYLDGVIGLLKTDNVLSKADVLLLTETDIGMGRSGNYNVSLEIANALNMNYCFATSFIVLSKGDIIEQANDTENTLSLHGMSILSKYKIESYKVVPIFQVQDPFYSREMRLGIRKALICNIRIGGEYIDFCTFHLDLRASPKQRARQVKSVLDQLIKSKSKYKLIGGDFNTTTYNLKNKIALFRDLSFKFLFLGTDRIVENYMKPEFHFERPLFELLSKYGYDYHIYNDRTKATFYHDFNKSETSIKSRQYFPEFIVNGLKKKLEPWNFCVPSRLDWFTGQGFTVVTKPNGIYPSPQVIEKPMWNNRPASDHNPIIVDLALS